MTDDPSSPPDSPPSGHAPEGSGVASLMVQPLAFFASLVAGLFVQVFVYVFLGLRHEHGNSEVAGILLPVFILACPALGLAALGFIVRRRRRAKLSGQPMNELAEIALLGLALSTMLMGVCAGVMITGSIVSLLSP
jgi:hypothetical protein